MWNPDIFEDEASLDPASPGEARNLQRRRLAAIALYDALLARENAAIARELHDDLGQVLTALKLNISLFALQHKADAVLSEKASAMLALNHQCMQTLCDLINRLRRPPDCSSGLAAAIESCCQDFYKRQNIPCVPTINLDGKWLDELRETVLLVFVREALNNISRHASASEAAVILGDTANDGLHLQIRDNGRGFDPGLTVEPGHFGLRLMRGIASALGGRFEIASREPTGTVITLDVPY